MSDLEWINNGKSAGDGHFAGTYVLTLREALWEAIKALEKVRAPHKDQCRDCQDICQDAVYKIRYLGKMAIL